MVYLIDMLCLLSLSLYQEKGIIYYEAKGLDLTGCNPLTAGSSGSEPKSKELLCLSSTAFLIALHGRGFRSLQVLRESGRIERGDLITAEIECAISRNPSTRSHPQSKFQKNRTFVYFSDM